MGKKFEGKRCVENKFITKRLGLVLLKMNARKLLLSFSHVKIHEYGNQNLEKVSDQCWAYWYPNIGHLDPGTIINKFL